jgi:DegV family protein with EDD domain
MRDYIIFTDATSDLTQDLIDKYNINVVPMHFTVGKDTYRQFPDFREIDRETFYTRMLNGEVSKTTAISPSDYLNEFSPYLEKGLDILYICFSSGMSSTFSSSMLATKILKGDFPNCDVISIDSVSASSGLGLLTLYAAKNKEAGMSLEENAKWIEENKLRVNHWYTPSDLFYLKRGGRVSTASAVVGTALRIKPVMNMDTTGHLMPYCNARGRKQSLKMLVEIMAERIENPLEQTIIISMADCEKDREFLVKKVNELSPVKEILHTFVGPIIGAHTGPSQAEIFYMGKARSDDKK